MSNTKKSAGGTAIPSAETKKSSKDIIRLAEGKVGTFDEKRKEDGQ